MFIEHCSSINILTLLLTIRLGAIMCHNLIEFKEKSRSLYRVSPFGSVVNKRATFVTTLFQGIGLHVHKITIVFVFEFKFK